jgi:cell wall-associated NlpC family hydrolase
MRFSGGQAKRLTALVVLGAAAVGIGAIQPAAADQTSDKQAEAAQIASKLDALDAQMMDLNSQYERANFELHQTQQKVADAQRLADETQQELQARQDQLRGYAVSAYQGGNDSAGLDAMLTAAPDEGVIKRAYVESVSGTRQDYVDALKTAKAAAKDDSTRLAQAQAEAERKASEIEKARTDAAAARNQQQALNDRVQGELATLVAQEQARRQAEQAAATPPPAPVAPRPAPASPAPRSTSPSPVVVDAPAPPPGNGGAASIAISAALSQVGKAYVWGAAGPDAYDCSGIVLWAYAKAGVSLPHYSGAMYNMTTRISASQLQPGDLVFYGPGGSDHVAIYMGGNQLVHAFNERSGVAVTALAGWWKPPSGYGRLNL